MIGILFATEMEAMPFLEGGAPEGTTTIVSGMGMAAARASAEKLIRDHGCISIVNAGVSGALGNRLRRGAVYRVSTVCSESSNAAIHVCGSFGRKKLVSVDEPVFQPERKRELSRLGDLVDMEGYAVALVCKEHDVPCILIKGVTDFGDAAGKEDIRRHIAPVSEAVAEEVRACLSRKRGRDGAHSLWRRLHSFTKVEHTVFSLPLLFAGAWLGAGGMPPIRALLLIALVGLGARTFGMAVNRILDRDIDATNPRTKNRELPSGTLSLGQGYGVALAGVACYFAGCALLGDLVLRLSLVPLVPLALYSLLKRFTALCHYGIGICLALAPLGAFVAVANSIDLTREIMLLSGFSFCWMAGFDIIYALLDIDFDRAAGVRSIPAALGARRAQLVAAATHLVAVALLVLLWMSVGGALSLLALLASAGAFGAAYLQRLPVPFRFFPVSAIAGISGALVVLLGQQS